MPVNIQHNVCLKAFNTLAMPAKAKGFVAPKNLDELKEIIQHETSPFFILGGGSNCLFTCDIDALVIHPQFSGMRVLEETPQEVLVEFGAGVVWHEAVAYCVKEQFYGIENLALIPGLVGAAPIQNIGAYGVELCDVFHSLDAMDMKTGELVQFNRDACHFGYRDSVFKHDAKGQYCITAVRLNLSKTPALKTRYRALEEYLETHNIANPTIDDVFCAVMNIRQSKLPDPKKLANAGSFFKNPIVTREVYETLKAHAKRLPQFAVDQQRVKIPAAWLIEQCGFKGYRLGDAGVHTEQALVLVNQGEASAEDILALCKLIQNQVYERFGIHLEPEVNIIT